MTFSKRLYYFSINELKRLKKAPLPIMLAIVAPIIAWACLAVTFQNGLTSDIPIAIVDNDNTQSSRLLIRYLDASEILKVVNIGENQEFADSLVKNGTTYGTVIIERGLSENLKTKRSTNVTVVANAAYMMYSKGIYKACAQIVGTLSAGIQMRRLTTQGLSANEALARVAPVMTDLHTLCNPYLDYSIYLIPGMLISILQMSASFSCLWIFRSRRESEEGRAIPEGRNVVPFLIAKITPLFLANTIAMLFLFVVIFPYAKIPINSSWVHIFGLAWLMMVVSMGMGAFVSIGMKNLVSAAQFLLLINAPSFVFSGYTFPRWAMPSIAQTIANGIPVTHFLDGFFPMYLYDIRTTTGIAPLIIIGMILWGGAFLLLTPAAGKLRSALKI